MKANKFVVYTKGLIHIYAGVSGLAGGIWLLALTEGNIASIVGAGIIISSVITLIGGTIDLFSGKLRW